MNHRFFFNSTTRGETGTFSVSAYPFRMEIISLRVQYSICIITVNDLCPLPCLTRCVSTITSRCTRYLGLPAVLTSEADTYKTGREAFYSEKLRGLPQLIVPGLVPFIFYMKQLTPFIQSHYLMMFLISHVDDT